MSRLTEEDFNSITNNDDLFALLKKKNISFDKVEEILSYNEELRLLQIELVKLQHHITLHNKRAALFFE